MGVSFLFEESAQRLSTAFNDLVNSPTALFQLRLTISSFNQLVCLQNTGLWQIQLISWGEGYGLVGITHEGIGARN